MSQTQVEQASQRIASLLQEQTSRWADIDTAQVDRLDNAALYLLCGAGLVELRFRGRGWTDQIALDFEATASGVWIDYERQSILPDEVRRAVPAWGGRAVAVQLQPMLQARLTTLGQETRRQAETDADAFVLALFVCKHPVRGRVTVRIVGNESPAPGAVPQDVIAGGGIVQALQDMVTAQRDIAAAVRVGGGPRPQLPPVEATHNADFTIVKWYGTQYTFALGVQSQTVQALWGEWEKSGLGLHQQTIRNQVDAEKDNFRLDTVFRNHPAFGTMIQKAGDGRYSLAPPRSKQKTAVRQNHV